MVMREFKDAKALIVDDEQHNRDLVKFFLKQSGFENFLEAENASEATILAIKNLPDIIFLDIQLEEDSGFDVCKILKENEKTKDIPILFLSAFSETENKVTGYKLGAVDFVHKPINHYELIARTKVHLKNGQLLKQLQTYQNRTSYELEKAKKTQNSIMPSKNQIKDIEKKHSLKIESVFQSSSELAGDYWKALELSDDKVMFTLADFSGHGVYSALNTVRLDLLIAQADVETLINPRKAIKYFNKALYETLPSDEFCAMVYIILDTKTGKAEYVASNSPDLYLLKNDNSEPISYKGHGFPLGLTKNLEETDYTYKVIDLKQGDTLISYSDALTEEPHENGERWLNYGLEQQLKEIQKNSNHEISKFDTLINNFQNSVKKPLNDDLTAIAITII